MAVEPQLRDLARRLKNVERQALQRKLPTLAFSTIDDGAITGVDEDGNLTIIIGKQFDGTTTTTSVGGPVPPTPLEPFVTETLGGLRVYWDGTFQSGAAPMDFSRVTVHAEPLSSFTGPDPIDPRWIVGAFGSATGGEITAALAPVEHVVYLVTWTESGKFSEASIGFGTPQDPADLAGGEVIVAPDTSPVPRPVVGPASVVVGFTPIFGTVTDLHVWLPPEPAAGDDYAAPTVSPDASTLHTQDFPPGGFIYTDVGGQPLAPGRPVWVALQARNATPPAAPASLWVQSSAGAIDPAYLELLAGDVIAQRLQAETITGVTITGSVLDILDALYAEPGYMEVKADLVEAKSAIFSDNVTRRGTNNFLEGTETASAGITDPGTPPTLSAHWPSIEFAGTWNVAGMHVDETAREVFAVMSNPLSLRVFDLDSGALKRTLSWVTASARVGVDITKSGNWFYIASYDNTSASDDAVHVWRYSALSANEGVRDATYDYLANPLSNQQNPQSFCMDADSAGEITQIWITENQIWRVRRWVADTQVTTKSGSALPGGLVPSSGEALAGMSVTLTGSDRQMFVQPYNADAIAWGQYAGVMTLDDAEARARPFGFPVIGADGNYTFEASGRLYQHKPLPDNLGTVDYTYTWYDSDPAGDGLAESRPSPPRSYRSPKGAYIRIKTPLPPDDGTVDAPDTVRVYCANFLQGSFYTPIELAAGRVIMTPIFTGGIQAPTTSGFDDRTSLQPGAYEASKGDADGPFWQLLGTGAGRVGPWSWDADGNVLTQPGNSDRVSGTDVITFTGSTPITVTHSLGVVPSAIIAQQASHVGANLNFVVLSSDSTATTFTMYCKDHTNAYISGARTVSWVAYR